MSSRLESEKEEQMRARVIAFLDGDPEATKLIGEMLPEEIRAGVKMAFDEMKKSLNRETN